MIAADDVDLPALLGQAGILDRHLDRDDRIGAADVGVEARHVVQHADLDGLLLGQCWRREPSAASATEAAKRRANLFVMVFPPKMVVRRLSFRNLPAALR